MTQIKIKRVYEPEERSDGYRVLVDKLWPRGIKKEDLHYDLWAKDATPSTPLREWFHEDQQHRWPEFEKLYADELDTSPAMPEILDKLRHKDTVTLLFAAKDTVHSHARVLQSYLEKSLSDKK